MKMMWKSFCVVRWSPGYFISNGSLEETSGDIDLVNYSNLLVCFFTTVKSIAV